jgi:hypothetical protein
VIGGSKGEGNAPGKRNALLSNLSLIAVREHLQVLLQRARLEHHLVKLGFVAEAEGDVALRAEKGKGEMGKGEKG